MKKNLVIDDDIVENKTLYKKVKYYCFIFLNINHTWMY